MLKRLPTLGAAVVACLAMTCVTASADGPVSEVRFGVLAHDVALFASNKESGADINAEIMFASPDWLGWLGRPRPHLGGSINTTGDTSAGYFGLTWDTDFADSLFFEFGAGGAVHDGKTQTSDPRRKELGCRALFHLSTSLGYRVTERVNLSVMLDHMSNASLCDRNESLNNAGLRLGYRF